MHRPVSIRGFTCVCVGGFRLKTCYITRLSPVRIAILDCCDYYGLGYIITRINVPKDFRGAGHASALLRQCTDAADSEHVRLFLEISPSDGLNYEQLEQFYMRHGFRRWKGIYRRDPIARTANSTD